MCIRDSNVSFSNSITHLGTEVFTGAPFINAYPDGIIYIDKCLYKYKGVMPAETTIEVADGTTQICEKAFRAMRGLVGVTIPSSVEEICDQAFYGCIKMTSVTIGDGARSIGNNCFSGCVSLESVTFGAAMTTIGNEAFSDCAKIETLRSGASVPPVLGDNALTSLDKWTTVVYVPNGCVADYEAADGWSDFLYIVGDQSGNCDIAADQLLIEGGVLHCNGIDTEVYNLSGVQVYSGNGNVQLATGTYIVVAAGRATKVAVK